MSDETVPTLVASDGAVDRKLVELAVSDPRMRVLGVGDPTVGWPARVDAAALLVICADDSDGALELVERAVRDFPGRPVVVACEGSPNGFLRRAFMAGAADVVTLDCAQPATDTYVAVAKAVTRSGIELGGSRDSGRVIVVLGPKGGTGKTLVATNLVAALAADGPGGIVVDLDLQFGDVGLGMGLRPERTIYDLAMSGGALDAQKLDGYLLQHASGARVLLAPTRPDHASAVSTELIRDVLGVARTMVPFVVVDTPPAFTSEVITALDAASDVCLVAMLDAPSLKNVRLSMETLDLMGIDPATLRLVLNRSDSSVGISHSDVVRILGRAPDILIPSQRDVVRSVNAGEPIVLGARRNEAGKALRALAGLYAKSPVEK